MEDWESHLTLKVILESGKLVQEKSGYVIVFELHICEMKLSILYIIDNTL